MVLLSWAREDNYYVRLAVSLSRQFRIGNQKSLRFDQSRYKSRQEAEVETENE